MIKEFQDKYRWLSNFAPCTIELDGIKYPSAEHAYMSAKSSDTSWKGFCANNKNSPGQVKKASRYITLVANWEEIKVDVMRECLEQKFNQNPYKQFLIDTGNQYIQEGNRWGDTFWGVCLRTNQGQNILGKLIMDIRERL
jgi:hypothetical protein